jgi:hypothetical protein
MVERYKPKVEEKEKEKLPAITTTGRGWTAKAARDWAYQTGELPHMFLLRVARGEAVKPGNVKPTFEEQVDAAKACAGYFAPKLQSVSIADKEEHEPPTQLVFNEEVLESLNDAELLIFQKIFGKLLGRSDPGASADNADKKKAENRYSRTLDLKVE